jgi:hypothetical protein
VVITTRKPVNMILPHTTESVLQGPVRVQSAVFSVALLGIISFPVGVAASQSLPFAPGTDGTPVLRVPGWGDEAAQARPLRRRLTEVG